MGNCEGKLYFFEINNVFDQCSATKVDEMSLNQVINANTNTAMPIKEVIKEVPNVRPKRRGAKNKTTLFPENKEEVDKSTHQGCEVMNFLPFPKSNGKYICSILLGVAVFDARLKKCFEKTSIFAFL